MLVPRLAARNVVAAGRGAIRPLHEKAEIGRHHGREEHHQRRSGHWLHRPAARRVLDGDQREGDLHATDLFLRLGEHFAVEHQPVLVNLDLAGFLADYRDEPDVLAELFGDVVQIEA